MRLRLCFGIKLGAWEAHKLLSLNAVGVILASIYTEGLEEEVREAMDSLVMQYAQWSAYLTRIMIRHT